MSVSVTTMTAMINDKSVPAEPCGHVRERRIIAYKRGS